uniref:Uncharacterized protein n=1 Tax=Arundo donax TaxID=35708 RepID=A0A0A9GT49_ARUDO
MKVPFDFISLIKDLIY